MVVDSYAVHSSFTCAVTLLLARLLLAGETDFWPHERVGPEPIARDPREPLTPVTSGLSRSLRTPCTAGPSVRQSVPHRFLS